MEVIYIGRAAFKLKGKVATTILDVDVEVEGFKINGPGEYEVRDVSVIGVAGESKTIYVIELDGLRIAYFSVLTEKLNESQMEDMGSIDLLLLNIDETNIKAGVALTRQIDPWVVIPSLGNTEAFLKEMGKEGVVAVPKYVVSPDKLPSDLTVVVLEKK